MAVKLSLKHTCLVKDSFQIKTAEAKVALKTLLDKTGKGNDFLGWMNLPTEIDDHLIDDILATANSLSNKVDVVVVIGIGGSYLGAKAVMSALNSTHYNLVARSKGLPEIYFAGTDLSGTALTELLEVIGTRAFGINVISKSGTTTEPAIAFRILRDILKSRIGVDAISDYIVATTDAYKGALKQYADANHLKSYIIPDDVGGRFSVFTPVGLLPIALSGIPIGELINGAKAAAKELNIIDDSNIAIQYAAARSLLLSDGKLIEILANYEPRLSFIAAWWKQLYGESEGKEGKGIFPASVDFTCDLHSMGQYIQEGPRHLFETILKVAQPPYDLPIPHDTEDLDGLNYLSDKTINYVNEKAMLGTLEAHVEGGVPNVIIEMDKLDAYHIGYLLYFFELACGISAYLLDVNPFDQPGVESYKKAMFRLLGKK